MQKYFQKLLGKKVHVDTQYLVLWTKPLYGIPARRVDRSIKHNNNMISKSFHASQVLSPRKGNRHLNTACQQVEV